METNDELIARHQRVKKLVATNQKQLDKMKLGSAARTRKAMFGGSLTFTLLQIESEMRDRNLKP